MQTIPHTFCLAHPLNKTVMNQSFLVCGMVHCSFVIFLLTRHFVFSFHLLHLSTWPVYIVLLTCFTFAHVSNCESCTVQHVQGSLIVNLELCFICIFFFVIIHFYAIRSLLQRKLNSGEREGMAQQCVEVLLFPEIHTALAEPSS